MQKLTTFSGAVGGVLFATTLCGCALFDKCAPENCSTDAQITQDVNALLAQHRELGPPATVHVQSINGVVYLSGQLDSDFEIRNAEALVRQVANVKDVENNLNPRSNAR